MANRSCDIFISYRREETPHAGRLRDNLVGFYSDNQVFMDTSAIPSGVDFRRVLANEIASCKVMLVVIGRRWEEATDKHGKRRLDNPNDFVRREVQAGLSRNIPVIPVLFDQANLPRAENLPQEIAQLTRRQAVWISHDKFSSDFTVLLRQLSKTEISSKADPNARNVSPIEAEIAPIVTGKLERPPRFFISCCMDDRRPVIFTYNVLRAHLERSETACEFYWTEDEFRQADCMLCFVGGRLGSRQLYHASMASHYRVPMQFIWLGGQKDPRLFSKDIEIDWAIVKHTLGNVTDKIDAGAPELVKKLLDSLKAWWSENFIPDMPEFDLKERIDIPYRVTQLLDYEKNIIELYSVIQSIETVPIAIRKRWPEERIMKILSGGAPLDWPYLQNERGQRENPLDPDKAGDFRGPLEEVGSGSEKHEVEGLVRAAALMNLGRTERPLTFPEAGPRRKLAWPQGDDKELKVAILVAGGISPGINAVIDAIVQRHNKYEMAFKNTADSYRTIAAGIRNGFFGIIDNGNIDSIPLACEFTGEWATKGGAMLGTSRDD
jgi:hypothetical protein